MTPDEAFASVPEQGPLDDQAVTDFHVASKVAEQPPKVRMAYWDDGSVWLTVNGNGMRFYPKDVQRLYDFLHNHMDGGA